MKIKPDIPIGEVVLMPCLSDKYILVASKSYPRIHKNIKDEYTGIVISKEELKEIYRHVCVKPPTEPDNG